MQRANLNSARNVLVSKEACHSTQHEEPEQETMPQSLVNNKKIVVHQRADAHSSVDSPEANSTGNARSTRRLPSLRPNMGWKGKHLLQCEDDESSDGASRRRPIRAFGGRTEHHSGLGSNGLARSDEISRRSTYYNQQPPQPSDTATRLPMPDWNNGSNELRQIVAPFRLGQQQQEEEHIDAYSYCSSLALFASNLGPAGQLSAAARIEQAIPPGIRFELTLSPPSPEGSMAMPISPRTADARLAAVNGFSADQLRRFIGLPTFMPPPGFH